MNPDNKPAAQTFTYARKHLGVGDMRGISVSRNLNQNYVVVIEFANHTGYVTANAYGVRAHDKVGVCSDVTLTPTLAAYCRKLVLPLFANKAGVK